MQRSGVGLRSTSTASNGPIVILTHVSGIYPRDTWSGRYVDLPARRLHRRTARGARSAAIRRSSTQPRRSPRARAVASSARRTIAPAGDRPADRARSGRSRRAALSNFTVGARRSCRRRSSRAAPTRGRSAPTSSPSPTVREDRLRRLAALARANGREQLHPRLAAGARRGRAASTATRWSRSRRPRPEGRRVIPAALEGIPLELRLMTLHARALAGARPGRGLGWPAAERWLGPFDVLHFTDWMYPPQRARLRATTIHDLVPLHFPEWVTPRTRSMHTRKYAQRGEDVRRDLRELGLHRRTTPRSRSASRATGSSSPTRGSARSSRTRARRPSVERPVRAHGRDARAAQEPRHARSRP